MKIRYVSFRGGHPTSQAIAKSLGAEFVTIKTTKKNLKLIFTFRTQLLFAILHMFFKTCLIKRIDGAIYLCEGIPNIIFPLLMRKIKNEKNKIIMRANDESFAPTNKTNSAKKFYGYLYKNINGVIAISTLVANDARKYVKCPIKISHTFLWRDYSELSKICPDFNKKNFVFVGEYRPHKGIDILAKVMKKVLDSTKSRIFFVGDGIKEGLTKKDLGDNLFEYVGHQNPTEYFKKSQFYVQTARYEAGGASIIEAMAAGLIPFVNEKTGNKDLVKEVDEQLILKQGNEAEQIINFLKKQDVEKLKMLSKKSKLIAHKNDLKHGTDNFKKAFYSIIKVIK